MSDWISVNEEWPEEYTYVLLCTAGRFVYEGWQESGKIWRASRFPANHIQVTHWKPMPEAA